MLRIGLTGGIAAGKSVVARRFVERGIPVIDYDVLSREVVAQGAPGYVPVVAAFGDGVVAADGELDRVALARRVFGDEAAREQLEDIVHPLVIAEGQRLDQATEARGATMVVHEVPLLVEVTGPEAFDAVIVVDAPVDTRVARLVAGRGLTEAEAWDRIGAQLDDADRLSAADVVFDGSGTVDHLQRQVDAWLSEVQARGAHYRPNVERTNFLVTEDVTSRS